MIKEDKIERCCKTPSPIIKDDGECVCENCGLILQSERYENVEKRVYSSEEREKRIRTEKLWRQFGPRTIIDYKKDCRDGKKKTLYGRLSRIQGSLVNSLERNLWEAYPKMGAMCLKLHIPTHIQESSQRIYNEVARQKLTMGRSIDEFISASLYCAIRVHRHPIEFETISSASLTTRRNIHRAIGLIVREVFPVLGLKYKPITPLELVTPIGNKLEVEVPFQSKTSGLIRRAMEKKLQTTGKDPKGIVAAAYYIILKSKGFTQSQIADASNVTEVTLRTRAKQIKQCIGKDVKNFT